MTDHSCLGKDEERAMSRVIGLMFAVLAASPAAELRLDFERAAALRDEGALLVGKAAFVAGRKGKGLRLCDGAHVRLNAAPVFHPEEGSVQMWIKPEWPSTDAKRHTFFHAGGGHAHVTLFAPAGGSLLFVYKADRESWHATSGSISHWQRDTWHSVRASWKLVSPGRLACLLEIDGQRSASSGAAPLPTAPRYLFLGGRGKREPADAVIDEVRISSKFTLPKLPRPSAVVVPIRVHAQRSVGPMPRTWSFVTPWNSKSYRIPFTRSHPYFRRFRDAGFELVRLVAFSESWLWGTEVTRDATGALKLDFGDFDALLDLYRAAGAEPYIRLAYHMPSALSPGGLKLHSYRPPRDIEEWRDFVKRIVRHCNVERGLGIRYWVTMLNEADIPIRRGQAKWESILDLYEATTRATLEVDPQAKVGGPATCGPLPGAQEESIRRFVRFCKERNLPPDFVCFHAYRRPHPKDYEAAVLAAKSAVESVWPELNPEYFLDEWNLWARDKTQNNEYGAAYVAAAIHYQMRAGLTRSSIVSFNTHFPPAETEGVTTTFRGPFRRAPGRIARFYCVEVEVAGTRRRCLYTHAVSGRAQHEQAYTFGRYVVDVPPQAVLRVATALAFPYAEADGVGMSVHVLDRGKDACLMAESVTQAAWKEHTLPLHKFAGRKVTVEFRTDCGPGKNISADHGLWGQPRVEAGGKTTFDFCDQVHEADTGWHIPRKWHTLSCSLPMIKGRVLTPIYFTYVLLNRLRGERLTVELTGRDGIHESDALGALACRDGKAIRVVLWHFESPWASLAQHFGLASVDVSRQVRLRIDGLHGPQHIRQSLIDQTHTNAYTDYVVNGKPTGGGEYNLETGRVDVVRDETRAPVGGTVELSVRLENLSVALIEIERR